MKLCKDCKHGDVCLTKFGSILTASCNRNLSNITYISPISGRRYIDHSKILLCSEERGSNEKCGKDARFFEEKESLIKRIKIAVMNILK